MAPIDKDLIDKKLFEFKKKKIIYLIIILRFTIIYLNFLNKNEKIG